MRWGEVEWGVGWDGVGWGGVGAGWWGVVGNAVPKRLYLAAFLDLLGTATMDVYRASAA